jgi:hypothetical protein
MKTLNECRRVSKILKNILSRCEQGFVSLMKISEDEHNRELSKVVLSYDMHGLTINMPYTDIDEIISRVHNTNIHVNDSQRAEFALAVHVVAYTNRVCSIWLYIASLTPKD